MSYFDDYSEYSDNCDYSEYDEIEEPVNFLIEGFSPELLSETLSAAGLIEDTRAQYSDSMEKFIFTRGDENEVYSTAEIKFIEKTNVIFVYNDIARKLHKGNIFCRTIAVKIDSDGYEALKECVSFEKIINKALNGFNIFFFVTNDAVFLGCKLFKNEGLKDCLLSKPIKTQRELEQFLDEILMVDDQYFADYYNRIISIIRPSEDDVPSYEEEIIKKRGLQNSYLNEISELERELGLNMIKEKERYMQSFEKNHDSFTELIRDVEESLSFIKSNRVNTYELLFDAEEMMRMAITREEEHQRLEQISVVQEDNDQRSDEEAKVLLDDLEAMIKLLKKRRGI